MPKFQGHLYNKTPGSETKNSCYSQYSQQCELHVHTAFPYLPIPEWQHQGEFRWMLCTQWVCVTAEDPSFREPKSSIMKWNEHSVGNCNLSLHLTLCSEGRHCVFQVCWLQKQSWKDSSEQRSSMLMLAKYAEMWETHRELPLNKFVQPLRNSLAQRCTRDILFT